MVLVTCSYIQYTEGYSVCGFGGVNIYHPTLIQVLDDVVVVC